MKNVLLDLGTHYGQGLREFIERFGVNDTWTVYTFEANPVTFEIFKKDYHNLTPFVGACNVSVSDHFGTITLNIESPPNEGVTGQGSSVIPLDNWDPWGNTTSGTHFKTQATVNCLDFSKFIADNFTKEDNIIVKMDIEGSEYDVLEKIKYLSAKFPHYNFVRGEKNLEDWQQMLLMSLCDNHIIANSTFSWWGAYFNNREKKVCYPSAWFGKKLQHHNLKDLFPSDWTEIKF
jgi:FkbM family methyltransferase